MRRSYCKPLPPQDPACTCRSGILECQGAYTTRNSLRPLGGTNLWLIHTGSQSIPAGPSPTAHSSHPLTDACMTRLPFLPPPSCFLG